MIAAFVIGSLVGILGGYALAIVLVTGWSFTNAVRFGLARAFRAKNMMAFYEKSAQLEREMYSLHFVAAMQKIGGPGIHIPTDEQSLRGLYKLAEERMKFEKRKRPAMFYGWADPDSEVKG